HFEKKETLERVQANYLAYAKNEPSRFVIIDGMNDPEETALFVAGVIRTMVKESGKRKVKGRKK
ncbi:MAG TPA: dTMP kinase, partial [Methanoregula sp.]|nr:dTMP kinase [Methanoregula sp.]